LGVITELDFLILRQRMLTRTVTPQTFWGFVNWTVGIQEGYKQALQTGDQTAISAALSPIDMTQVGAA
jgi:hypothetical protein